MHKFERIILPASIPGASRINRWIDGLVTALEHAVNPSFEGMITVTSGPHGICFKVPEFPLAIVKTTSTITARSGTTPGTGTADFQLFNGTDFYADSARAGQDVLNYSANSTLTVSGKYGVAIKWFGRWWLVVVEC